MTKEDILKQLEKAGVNDLDDFAEFLIRETSAEDESGQPVASDIIVVSHGFYHH